MSYADPATGEIVEVKAIPIGLIDNGPAVRTELLDDAHAQALFENIDHLPNIKVRIAGDRFELIDGRHRLAAHKFAHRDAITAEVYDLDDREHWLMAVEANTKHGRGLSLTERRRNAQRTIAVAPDMSNREIARRCGLSHMTVGKLRPEPEGGQIGHLDRAGEAESGDASDGDPSLRPSPAQPSSDDGGVSVSESTEPATPADSYPAPSSDTLEEPAGDSLTGEGEDRAVPPSPDQRSKDLAEVGRRLKQVSEFFQIWSPDELHALNDLHTTESVRLVFEVISPWWQEYKQTQPRGLRVVNGEQP